MKHEGGSDTNCNRCTRKKSLRIGKKTGRLGKKRTSRDYPSYNIIKISQNTEKRHGNWRRLAVTQIPVKNYDLTLV